MTTRQAHRMIRNAESSYNGINCTRWYTTVHPKRNGEAVVKTWAVKTWKGKPLIMLAALYPTNGRNPIVSGRCLINNHYNSRSFNWLDYGGSPHVAVWEDVDGCRNEMLPAYEHEFGVGIEHFGMGEWLNGFEDTKYKYGCFEKSGLRVTDWLQLMNIDSKTELVIKSGYTKWLDPRYLPTLADNKGLLSFIRNGGDNLKDLSPYRIIQMFQRTGGDLDFSRVQKMEAERSVKETVAKFRLGELVFKPKRILSWLEKNDVSPAELRHHLDNLRELNMDTDYEPHAMPKDFKLYSLQIEERVQEKRKQEKLIAEDERMEKIKEARKARIWARKTIRQWIAEGKILNGYDVVIPNSRTELATEGKAMNNCVGGYWDRYSIGSCDLVFIRKNGKPYIDMEICDGRIVQTRRNHNEDVTNEREIAMCNFIASAFNRKAA